MALVLEFAFFAVSSPVFTITSYERNESLTLRFFSVAAAAQYIKMIIFTQFFNSGHSNRVSSFIPELCKMNPNSLKPKRILEVCIDNVESGIAAERGGAGRIELCSSLAEGGLTPSVGFLKIMKQLLQIPIFVMIRPRGGDFLYTDEEIAVMKEDIQLLKAHGADGFVFGMLSKNGSIDEPKCLKLLAAASPLPVTFHRAFDLIPDVQLGLETVIRLGFQRILTSGQSSTALAGVQIIQNLVENSKNRIAIMAGAGVNPANVKTIIDMGNPTEVHASCRIKIASKMEIAGTGSVSMGSTEDEMNICVTDSNIVRSIVQQII